MSRQLPNVDGDRSFPGSWPSIASASAQLRLATTSRLGQMQAENPAVFGRILPVGANGPASARPATTRAVTTRRKRGFA